MTVFYETFERHAHGEGLKGRSTHYCPGCGHGLVHRYLGDAIEKLGVQDRTVVVSPVGCSVFLYYYLDVGNTQAAHGRAPAVALGHKLANPESIVVSYQGDGDLASIGLAEIIHAAQLGLPISVVFVNNAIYGMTGGQMAPTTLMGQRTATTPEGRGRITGQPLRMAEMVAGLDGPVYVERVALYDAKRRIQAGRAIEKALRLQVERVGFSFVEVLAECPTHLGLTPGQAESWVREQMLPVFPLGLKTDVTPPEDWSFESPKFSAKNMIQLVGAETEPVTRHCAGFPHDVFGPEVGLKLAGAGGDGAQTAAMLLTRTAIDEGFDATHIPSYGPESRGGTSYADVRMAEGSVLSPAVPRPHVLVAFNAPSLKRFGPLVEPGGVIVYDSAVVSELPELDPRVRLVPVPCSRIAAELGRVMVKNIVALGALQAATGLLPEASLLSAIRRALSRRSALLPLNEEAFARGVAAASGAAQPA